MLFACFIAFRPIVHAKVEREKPGKVTEMKCGRIHDQK
jgi:hypothetical protein